MTLELLKSKTGRTLIESHRGIEADVPENSWSAIQMGHRLGADLIEVDIQMSRDCIPFLRHNYQLSDGRWCHELLWQELQAVEINGEPLPKLVDVLFWARQTGAKLSLDIKTIFSPEGSLTREVIRLLEQTDTINNVQLLFIDHSELLQTKLVHPELTVRALVTGRLANYADYLNKIKADSVSISYGMFRPVDIEEIHSIGASVSLSGLWRTDTDLFRNLEIDVFSHSHPVEAKKILNYQ